MLKKFKLGSEAIEYIKYSLARGDTLSKYLLELPIIKGQVTTYLPTTTSRLQRLKFETGGVVNSSETEENLVSLISSYLGKPGKKWAVFETLARPGDKSLRLRKAQFFTYNQSEVYNFVTSDNNDPEKITNAIRSAKSYPFVAILTSISDVEVDIGTDDEITKNFLGKLAKGAEYILIGAYDDEAVLIWNKQ